MIARRRSRVVTIAGRRVRLFSDDDGKSWSSSPADLTAYRRRIEQALAPGGDHELHTAAHWRRQRDAQRRRTARSTARQAALDTAVAASEISAGATAYGALLRRFAAAIAATGITPPALVGLATLARQQVNTVLIAAGLESLSREEIELARGRHHRD